MSEYKSPIKVTIEDISNEVIERYDNEIIYKVKKITGIDVDKQRLINALLLDKKLVRCKDCRYGSRDVYDYDCSNVMPIWCEYCNDYRNEMDFCSRGVKR